MTALSRDARVAGLLYILASAVGIVRLLYIPKLLFVRGDAAATAANIAAHEPFFRLGILSYLVAGIIWLFVPLALYRLLKGVDQALAIVMVILGSLMQTPMYIINTVTDAAALMLVHGANSSPSSTRRSATPSPCCSFACITTSMWPTPSWPACGSFPSACWWFGRAFFRASSACG